MTEGSQQQNKDYDQSWTINEDELACISIETTTTATATRGYQLKQEAIMVGVNKTLKENTNYEHLHNN